MIVEIVHPFVKELSESGEFADCQQCVKATGSVMDANLLLFKTVIAGDSWGQIAVPVPLGHMRRSLNSLRGIISGIIYGSNCRAY